MYFFDSFGNEPCDYGGDISWFYNMYVFDKTIVFKTRIQVLTSYTCGAYVIYFAYKMFECENSFVIKRNFSRVLYAFNDRLVVNFVNNLLGIERECNRDSCQYTCMK